MIRDFTADFFQAIRVEHLDNDPKTYIVHSGAAVLILQKWELPVLAHLLQRGGETSFGFTEVRITFKYGLTRIRLDPLDGLPLEIRMPTEGSSSGCSASLAKYLFELSGPW